MPILSIQSHVVYGHVGNSAVTFVLQRLGMEVWPLNTVQFSNHTGYADWEGRVTASEEVQALLEGLSRRDIFSKCDAVLSGYLGSSSLGDAVLDAVALIKSQNKNALWCCDPVMGDEGRGFFVAPAIAEFFKKRALHVADLLTPNQFELEQLTDIRVSDLNGLRLALRFLHSKGPRLICVTSARLADTPEQAIDVVLSVAGEIWRLRLPKLPLSPNGAGDVVAGLILYHFLQKKSPQHILESTGASIFALLMAMLRLRTGELPLIAAQDEMIAPERVFVAERL
jgi:pyridoxine kinase